MNISIAGQPFRASLQFDPGDEFVYLSFERATEYGPIHIGSMLLDPTEARSLIAELERGIALVESQNKEGATT